MSVLVQKICVLYAIIYSLSLSAATVKASAASKVDLPAVGQSHYLGCWQDADEGKDKHRATVARDLTVNVVTCIPMCWNLRHLYALLKVSTAADSIDNTCQCLRPRPQMCPYGGA
ncbi:hypothetical protein C0Q70_02811 [Pomacea canaliculata]|uniref:Uncharacterized protein n=1 Tax=Pomacea canaliculata TaxID=400727 RepID=A0A2T7PQY5_POMCA|nr:hypothetical protein C0Q70_02811 [Pomacea canaliculata]